MSGRPLKRANDRQRRAKSEVSHNRISTETLRKEFRANFFNRLRNTRSKSVDRLRQIVEDYGETVEYRSISDIRRLLLQDEEASNLLQTEEVSDLLNEIEEELEKVNLNRESEEHIRIAERETEDIVERLLSVCRVCGNMSEMDNICPKCALEFTTEFK